MAALPSASSHQHENSADCPRRVPPRQRRRAWRNRSTPRGAREQQLSARPEFNDALAAAFGPDAAAFGGGDSGQLDFLSTEKRDALRRITQDYDEMMAAVPSGGIQLASDKEKLRRVAGHEQARRRLTLPALLKAERERDIAALLTPDEQLAYEMRTSSTAGMVRARYGEGIETEDDFRKIYALQKAFDDKYPLDAMNGRVTPDTMKQRNDAQRQLQDDTRTALGKDKYAALRRATPAGTVGRLVLSNSATSTDAPAHDFFVAPAGGEGRQNGQVMIFSTTGDTSGAGEKKPL
jgi:hypothetical protein